MNNFYHWKFSDFVLDLNYFSFSHPYPDICNLWPTSRSAACCVVWCSPRGIVHDLEMVYHNELYSSSFRTTHFTIIYHNLLHLIRGLQRLKFTNKELQHFFNYLRTTDHKANTNFCAISNWYATAQTKLLLWCKDFSLWLGGFQRLCRVNFWNNLWGPGRKFAIVFVNWMLLVLISAWVSP